MYLMATGASPQQILAPAMDSNAGNRTLAVRRVAMAGWALEALVNGNTNKIKFFNALDANARDVPGRQIAA